MGRFGEISPEVRARFEAQDAARKEFFARLHALAQELAEKHSIEDLEGDPGYQVKYPGKMSSNYPWVYIDFTVQGTLPISVLADIEARFKLLCESCEQLASYLTTNLYVYNRRLPTLRCRLIYREDLKR